MRVAFGKIKITPKEVVGVPMAGYARPKPCLGKFDDIYAHGVLVEAKSYKNEDLCCLLLISLDLLKVPRSIVTYIKEKICSVVKSLNPENILIHSTHTHSAPDLTGEFFWPGGAVSVAKGIMFGTNRNDKYIVWVATQIERLVQKLMNQLAECKIGWVKKPFNPDLVINRRHPSRRSTPDLGVISFQSLGENSIIGIIVNYACHPTTLSLWNYKMSADFPGRVVYRIEEKSSNGINAAYFNGPAGDLNPITTCGTDYEELEKNKSPIYSQKGVYKHTKKIGYAIADKALELAKLIKDDEYFEDLKIQVRTRKITIPMKDHKYFSNTWFMNKLIYALKKFLIVPVAMHLYDNANFPPFLIKHNLYRIKCDTIIQDIQCVGILKSRNNSKKFNITTTPGELFEDLGKILVKKSPNDKNDTFIFQNANDWIAYLFPLEEYAKEGGYEPVASFGPLCGEYIKRAIIDLYDSIEK
ncbi:MAG: hypothetical protein GF383_13120 [Candidatus Lokiarchaeota archaeon]|nr:hypothetical protein [Candidatus Lokiarchaeota archaeon]MBD3342070.1 hypothetical protein [Candidatus Lokiarchaeota archaeon]